MNLKFFSVLVAAFCSLAACDKTDKPHEGSEQEHGHKHVFELVKGVQITDCTDGYRDCYRCKDCTSLRTAPYLPALDLAEECYQCMFLGCHELDSVKAMFLDASPEYLEDWLLYTAEKGTFMKNPAAVWDRQSAGVPEGWEITDAS